MALINFEVVEIVSGLAGGVAFEPMPLVDQDVFELELDLRLLLASFYSGLESTQSPNRC